MPLVFILVLVSTLWILQFGLMIALQGSCMLFYFNFSYRYLNILFHESCHLSWYFSFFCFAWSDGDALHNGLFVDSLNFFHFYLVFYLFVSKNLNFFSDFSYVLFFPLFYDIYLQDFSWIHSLLCNSFSFTRKFLKPLIGIFFSVLWFCHQGIMIL